MPRIRYRLDTTRRKPKTLPPLPDFERLRAKVGQQGLWLDATLSADFAARRGARFIVRTHRNGRAVWRGNTAEELRRWLATNTRGGDGEKRV